MSWILDRHNLRVLVDWAYLHASEGQCWPSTKSADELIDNFLVRAPTQADADVFKSGKAVVVKAGDGT